MGQKPTPEQSGYTLDIYTERGYSCVENLTLAGLAAACLNAVHQCAQHLAWPALSTPMPWRASSYWGQPGAVVPYLNLVARSSRGKRLDVPTLLQNQARLVADARAWRWSRRRLENWNGEGPVPGTGTRGGYSRHYRRPHTQGERRQAIWLVEEGEPAIRAARHANYLPTRWDDIHRRTERNWKSQHKGRKAWDRG